MNQSFKDESVMCLKYRSWNHFVKVIHKNNSKPQSLTKTAEHEAASPHLMMSVKSISHPKYITYFIANATIWLVSGTGDDDDSNSYERPASQI